MNREAADEIERLRAELVSTTNRLTVERDEAQRRICEMLHEEGYGRSPEEWAERKGWDCFKDNP